MKRATIAVVAATLAVATLSVRAETKDKRAVKPLEVEASQVAAKEEEALKKALRKAIIREMDFQQANLHDVAKFLSKITGKNFNIVVAGANAENSPTLTLSAQNISLYEALRLVCEVTGSELRIDEHAVVIVCGKGAPPNTYGVKLKIAPVEGQTNQFKVEFRISEKQPDGEEHLLSAPMLTVLGGNEGIIKVVDENENNGVICAVTVTPGEKALLAVTSVTIKRDGKVLWSCSQETTIAK